MTVVESPLERGCHEIQRKSCDCNRWWRGIGRAIALALAREGANVTVAARTQAQIEAGATEIRDLGQQSLALSTDVTQFSDRATWQLYP